MAIIFFRENNSSDNSYKLSICPFGKASLKKQTFMVKYISSPLQRFAAFSVASYTIESTSLRFLLRSL